MAKKKTIRTIPQERTPMREQEPQLRARNFEEVACGYRLEDALREAERWEIEREMEQDWRNESEYQDDCYEGCWEDGQPSTIAPFMGDNDASSGIVGAVVVYGIVLMLVVALISKMCLSLINRIRALSATRRVARSPK